MASTNFRPIENASPAPGMVLRVGETDSKYLRLTHVFDSCIYAMWVSEPTNARYARRPKRMLLGELQRLAKASSSSWGRLVLPSAISTPPPPESERSTALDTAWNLVEPIIQAFEEEKNLSRFRYTFLIRERAEAMQTSFITLNRMVIRYYYFGGTRLALLPLTTGVIPGEGGYASVTTDDSSKQRSPKRRGRKTILASVLGANTFVTSDDDLADMVATLKTCLRRGPTYLTSAHEEYLAGAFKKRHPEIYAEYLGGKLAEPVTVRQYRYCIHEHATLDDDLAKNLRTQDRNPGYLGSLYSAGPGEVYEIDATGGRLHLVSNDETPVLL